jgi:hypothetical protein
MILEFLERSGFHRGSDSATFCWNPSDEFKAPGHIHLVERIVAEAVA